MTRIVFYNHTGQVSGAEKMLLMALRHLSAEFNLSLVCPEMGPLHDAVSELEIPQYVSREIVARFTYNPFRLVAYSRSILRALVELRQTFKMSSPDLIHANTVRAGIVATLATAGMRTPVVWHNHDMLPSHPFTFAIRLLAGSSRRVQIVGCSMAAARSLRPIGHVRKDAIVIHNGIEIAPNEFGDQGRTNKRRELRILPEQFAVGIVGQLTPRKGQLELIRAFAEVKHRLPNAVLIICGRPIFNRDEEYLVRLHREAERLKVADEVRFLGHRSDAQEVIGSLDLCVLNSAKEPFALTLIEAMAMGTAVVATDCGGPTEIISHGENGEIVEVGDHLGLVDAIVRMGRDPDLRRRYCVAASARVRREHSREKYISKWASFIEP